MTEVTVVILTMNEELNIRCSIGNVMGWAKEVFVLDSGSTDRTVEIAKEMGAKTFFRKFDTYAKQRNYAIKELPIETEWMLFLDADEYLTDELKQEIEDVLSKNPEENGFYMKRRFYFMGRWIKHGGYYPTILLRLFKKDFAKVERDINEHVHVDGKVGFLKHDFADENRKTLSDWIAKHNKYSTFEAIEMINVEKNLTKFDRKSFFNAPKHEKKKMIMRYIWNKIPPMSRPFLYFTYRYFFKLGFLDGKEGLIYFMMLCFIMTTATSAKYYELKNREKYLKHGCGSEKSDISGNEK